MKIPNYFLYIFTNILQNKNFIINKISNFVILFILIFFIIFFQPINNINDLKIGDKLNEDIIAQADVTIIDIKGTKKREDIIKITTPPTYIFENKIIKDVKNNVTEFINQISKSKNISDISDIIEKNNIKITNIDYKNIKEIIRNDKDFKNKINNIINKIYTNGIIELDKSNLFNLQISGIRIGQYNNNKLYYTLNTYDELQTIESVLNNIKYEIEKDFDKIDVAVKDSIYKVFYFYLKPNILYNKEISELRLRDRIKSEATAYKEIKTGQLIAEKGTIVDEDILNEIKSSIIASEKQVNIYKIFSIIFFTIFILIFLYLLINFFERKSFADFQNYIFISIIFLFIIIYYSIPIYLGYNKLSIYYGYYIPISGFTLSLLFLYSRTFSAYFLILLTVILYYITGFNNYAFLFVFISGILTIFSIRRINKRIDLLFTSLIISFYNIIASAFIILLLNNKVEYDLSYIIIFSISNGIVSSIIAIGLIILGEAMLNTATVFRLQELSLISTPLLKDLFNSAIGTYNHSITVGNLSEAAALEIGANELLAKVGGYYHDIGKLENPEYFIENQNDINKHDDLKPTISTSIIKAHVKIGVEKAKRERLPKKVVDIIAQHHGNTLIKYFYEEAIKNIEPDKEEVQKIDFQYQNKNPDFPESAIVLLADQVEAATRALKKYTMTTIEKLIEKLIDEKFQEGILDDSGLTLKDLTKIKKVFCKIVTGMYHPRIDYPESTNNTQKQNFKNIKNK